MKIWHVVAEMTNCFFTDEQNKPLSISALSWKNSFFILYLNNIRKKCFFYCLPFHMQNRPLGGSRAAYFCVWRVCAALVDVCTVCTQVCRKTVGQDILHYYTEGKKQKRVCLGSFIDCTEKKTVERKHQNTQFCSCTLSLLAFKCTKAPMIWI